jgi:hypothetical protein
MDKSFIGIYDNALTKQECDLLISQFEKSPQDFGDVYHDGKWQVRLEQKKCKQLNGPKFSDRSMMSNILRTTVDNCIRQYEKEYPPARRGKLDDLYAFKKFEAEDDGFKMWHCEASSAGTAKRVLVWSFYLNNAKSGTEFLYYPTIRARMGRCVIFPAAWTHTHRSAPNKGLKYFVSGWISYE